MKQSIIKDLTEKAGGKGKKTLSYTDISNRLGDIDLDKDQMDEIYDASDRARALRSLWKMSLMISI